MFTADMPAEVVDAGEASRGTACAVGNRAKVCA